MAMYLGDQKVRITDKSKTNLLDVFNRTEGKLTSGGSNTSIRSDIEFDKYYVGMTANNYYYPKYIKEAKVDPLMKTVFVSSLGGGYGISFPVKCEPNKTYTYSAETIGIFNSRQGFLRVGFYKEDKSYISFISGDTRNFLTFTTPENCAFLIILCALHKDQEAIFTNICLVEGSFSGTTFTDYEPYNTKLQPPMIQANNLIPYPWAETRQEYTDAKGITYKVNPDKSITVNGTCTQTSTFGIIAFAQNKPLKAGTYFLSGTPENAKGATMNCQISVQYKDANNVTIGKHDRGKGVCFTLNTDVNSFGCFLAIVAGTYNNVTFKPMLNKGEFALPFRPYSEEPEYIY